MYSLKVNDYNLYFKEFDNVKKWFNECGVEKELELEDESILIDNLDELLDMGDIEVYNECLFEMGSDYCDIRLERIEFED